MWRKSATLAAFLSCIQIISVTSAIPYQSSLAQKMRELLPNGASCLLDINEGIVIASSGEELLLGEGRPVGSVLKIFTSYALLAAGAAANEIFYCSQSSPDTPATSACWFRPGHRNMTLKSALASSCNAYFRQWLEGKNLEPVEEFMRELGLVTGALPSDSAEKAMALTGLSPVVRPRPAELISAAAALFNNGVLYRLSHVESGERCAPVKTISLETHALAVVLEGMRECAASGTGRAAQEIIGLTPILVKTGTSMHWTPEGLDPTHTDGWCIALYPADKPRYILFVFAPETMGASGAAEAAGEILKTFLNAD